MRAVQTAVSMAVQRECSSVEQMAAQRAESWDSAKAGKMAAAMED